MKLLKKHLKWWHIVLFFVTGEITAGILDQLKLAEALVPIEGVGNLNIVDGISILITQILLFIKLEI